MPGWTNAGRDAPGSAWWQELAPTMHRRTYRKGDTLFHEGDAGDLLYLIERGRVAIRVTTALGDVVTLAVLGRGDTFGEQALVAPDSDAHGERRRARGRRGAHVAPARLRGPRRSEPTIDAMLVDVLAAQVRRLSSRLQEALFLPADRRVLRRLAELVAVYGRTTASCRSRCRCARTTWRRWRAPRDRPSTGCCAASVGGHHRTAPRPHRRLDTADARPPRPAAASAGAVSRGPASGRRRLGDLACLAVPGHGRDEDVAVEALQDQHRRRRRARSPSAGRRAAGRSRRTSRPGRASGCLRPSMLTTAEPSLHDPEPIADVAFAITGVPAGTVIVTSEWASRSSAGGGNIASVGTPRSSSSSGGASTVVSIRCSAASPASASDGHEHRRSPPARRATRSLRSATASSRAPSAMPSGEHALQGAEHPAHHVGRRESLDDRVGVDVDERVAETEQEHRRATSGRGAARRRSAAAAPTTAAPRCRSRWRCARARQHQGDEAPDDPADAERRRRSGRRPDSPRSSRSMAMRPRTRATRRRRPSGP